MALPIQHLFIPAVQFEAAGPIVISNLDGNGLRFEWTIRRDNTSKPDEGEVSIYNLSPTLSGAMFEAWQLANAAGLGVGYLVFFSIGWDRLPKRVFLGDCWDMVPQDRSQQTDVVTTFRLGENNRPNRDQVVARVTHGGDIVTLIIALAKIVPAADDIGGGGLGLLVSPESVALMRAEAQKLSIRVFGNLPAGANTRDAIDIYMATLGLEWRVHNGEFVVMRGGAINKKPQSIRPKNGLINYSKRNDGGAHILALANPEIEPGLQIQVTDDLGRPFGELAYRVEEVTFLGDTDSDSIMEISAAKARVI